MPDKLCLQCDECVQKETVPNEVVTCQPCNKPVECYIRRYYSDVVILADKIANAETNGTLVDQDLSQVKYVVSEICNYTSTYIDLCRCIFCLPLHTAVFPDRNDIETLQYIAIRCVNMDSPLAPMYRRGCKEPDARAEFIVKP